MDRWKELKVQTYSKNFMLCALQNIPIVRLVNESLCSNFHWIFSQHWLTNVGKICNLEICKWYLHQMMIPITFLSTWYRRNIHNTYCPKWSWSLGYCVMVYCLWKHTRRIHLIWWPIKKQVGHMLTFTSIVKVIQLILNYPPNWCLWFIFWFHLCQLTWINIQMLERGDK